jgi:hypothetical protein
VYEIPTVISLVVIATVLVTAAVASILRPLREP